MPSAADALFGRTELFDPRDKAEKDNDYEVLIAYLLEKSRNLPAARKVLSRLFPIAGHLLGGSQIEWDPDWRSDKRVASSSIFHRYFHLTNPADEVGSSVVDEGVIALTDPTRFGELVSQVEKPRLNDFLDQLRERNKENLEPDVLGVSLELTRLIPDIPRGGGFFDVDSTRRACWLIEDLFLRLESVEARIEVASQCILDAPSLSISADLLRRWRLPATGPTDQPELDLLQGDELRRVVEVLAERIRVADTTVLAKEHNVFWLLLILNEGEGEAAVLRRLEDPRILVATLRSNGTSVRPTSDDGVSINVGPLVKLAGDEILNQLDQLREDESLNHEERYALERAIHLWKKQEGESSS